MAEIDIRVRVNGEERRTAAGQTVLGLLMELALDPQRVAVELNREIIRRPEWEGRHLEQGDCLEIVEFVGGG
jgi:thiamine biosynthesis protein ThiS